MKKLAQLVKKIREALSSAFEVPAAKQPSLARVPVPVASRRVIRK